VLGVSDDVTQTERSALDPMTTGVAEVGPSVEAVDQVNAMLIRTMPGGRMALTRWFAGKADDNGRPTLELRTMLFGSQDWADGARMLARHLLGRHPAWDDGGFASGVSIVVELPQVALAAADRDIFRLADLVRPDAMPLRLSDDRGMREALIGLVERMQGEESKHLQWGVGLAHATRGLDIMTLTRGAAIETLEHVWHRADLRDATGGLIPSLTAPPPVELESEVLSRPEQPTGPAQSPKPHWSPPERSRLMAPVVACLLALLVVAAVLWWSLPGGESDDHKVAAAPRAPAPRQPVLPDGPTSTGGFTAPDAKLPDLVSGLVPSRNPTPNMTDDVDPPDTPAPRTPANGLGGGGIGGGPSPRDGAEGEPDAADSPSDETPAPRIDPTVAPVPAPVDDPTVDGPDTGRGAQAGDAPAPNGNGSAESTADAPAGATDEPPSDGQTGETPMTDDAGETESSSGPGNEDTAGGVQDSNDMTGVVDGPPTDGRGATGNDPKGDLMRAQAFDASLGTFKPRDALTSFGQLTDGWSAPSPLSAPVVEARNAWCDRLLDRHALTELEDRWLEPTFVKSQWGPASSLAWIQLHDVMAAIASTREQATSAARDRLRSLNALCEAVDLVIAIEANLQKGRRVVNYPSEKPLRWLKTHGEGCLPPGHDAMTADLLRTWTASTQRVAALKRLSQALDRSRSHIRDWLQEIEPHGKLP
jgi:hypothetical protein